MVRRLLTEGLLVSLECSYQGRGAVRAFNPELTAGSCPLSSPTWVVLLNAVHVL